MLHMTNNATLKKKMEIVIDVSMQFEEGISKLNIAFILKCINQAHNLVLIEV